MAKTSELFDILQKQMKKMISPVNEPANDKVDQKESLAQLNSKEDHQAQKSIHSLIYQQFPLMTHYVFGKKIQKINQISQLILPVDKNQIIDEIIELLLSFSVNWATTEKVVEDAGVKNIQQLQHDLAKSQRIATALVEKNKLIAGLQGGASGLTGLFGAILDVPSSIILSFKTVCEIAHSYGFELDNEEDQKIIYYIFSQVDLSLIVEKQAIFLSLIGLNKGYSQQLKQNLLAAYDIKDTWLDFDKLQQKKLVKYSIRLFGGAVGTFYNVKLIEEIALFAHKVFSSARQYLLLHPEADISIFDAYQKRLNIEDITLVESSVQQQIIKNEENNFEQQKEVQITEIMPNELSSQQENVTQHPENLINDQSAPIESKIQNTVKTTSNKKASNQPVKRKPRVKSAITTIKTPTKRQPRKVKTNISSISTDHDTEALSQKDKKLP